MSATTEEPIDGGMADGTWDRLSIVWGYVSETGDTPDSDGFMDRLAEYRRRIREERTPNADQ
jgi:hypothetical protein